MLILIICGLTYVHIEQPKLWNDSLDRLKIEQDAPNAVASTSAGVPAENDAATDVADSKSSVASTVQIITPDSTNSINSEHVKQVEQPVQPNSTSIAANPVTTTNAIVRSAPKTFVPPDPIPVQPNWTWKVLGREYHNVVVTSVEADCVHITYDGGIGSINQSDLLPQLQKMFNYDPTVAAQAAQQKAAEQAKVDAQQAPLIAAQQQREKAQADADESQRIRNIQNQSAAMNITDAQTQKQGYQNDVEQMQNAHEINIYNNPTTGLQVTGTPYWLDKYNADTQAIARCDQIINSRGK